MMWRKLILTAALVAAAVPALAQSQQGTPQERTACAPAVRKFCKSANEDSIPWTVPTGGWNLIASAPLESKSSVRLDGEPIWPGATNPNAS